MRKTKKPLAAAMCALVIALGVNATVAWLTDESERVANTFTVGNIDIVLDESKLNDDGTLDENTRVQSNAYKMVPGHAVAKDPRVTVLAGSEDCYLFVKVTKTGGATVGETTYGFANYLRYGMAAGWTPLDGHVGVYYREVAASDSNQDFYIIADNKVTVKDTVTKEMMDAFDDDGDSAIDEGDAYPQLSFTAYAVQLYKSSDATFTAGEAWEKANA